MKNYAASPYTAATVGIAAAMAVWLQCQQCSLVHGDITFTCTDIGGKVLAAVNVSPDTTSAQLKTLLGEHLGISSALLQIIALHSKTALPPHIPLVDLGMQTGDTITCVKLQPPIDYDYVGKCDSCYEYRHLFYGYSRNLCYEFEAVIALCQACGGKKHYASSDGSSDHDDEADDKF